MSHLWTKSIAMFFNQFSLETHFSPPQSKQKRKKSSFFLLLPYAARTPSMWYLHPVFSLPAPDLSDRWALVLKRFHKPFVSCGCLGWWAAEIMDFSGWCTLLNSVMAGLQKCVSYCCEATSLCESDLMSRTVRSVLLVRISIPALKTQREKVRQ